MGTGWFFLILFLLALALSAYVEFEVMDAPWGLNSVSEMFGGAAVMLVLPALVITPWRVIQARRRSFSNTPLIAGAILFGLWALFYVNGMKMDYCHGQIDEPLLCQIGPPAR